jgi:hypothetical protein
MINRAGRQAGGKTYAVDWPNDVTKYQDSVSLQMKGA